ncbi:hypothetical protein ACH5BF_11885 [Arcobacter sp. YIC-464]|uniref:hypothetical protein n=1 Tax=Arcobacter sp. YIC-464 TaxID=3376631 RepID=UPI003C2658FE
MGIIKNFLKSFIKLSRPRFFFNDNKLIFKIDSDNFYTYEIDNYETKTRHDSYVLDAYTLKTDAVFLEHIHIDNDVQWEGLPSSIYISFLKDSLRIKQMDVLEKIEFDGFDFITYKIDNHFILNFIYIYEINKDTFILDVKSELYTNLLKKFDSSYTYKFEQNSDETLSLDLSIVKQNGIYGYFKLDN